MYLSSHRFAVSGVCFAVASRVTQFDCTVGSPQSDRCVAQQLEGGVEHGLPFAGCDGPRPCSWQGLSKLDAPLDVQSLSSSVSIFVLASGSARKTTRWLREFFPHLDLCPLVREVVLEEPIWDMERLKRPKHAVRSGRIRFVKVGAGARYRFASLLRVPYVAFVSDTIGYDCPTLMQLLVTARHFPGRVIGPPVALRSMYTCLAKRKAFYSFEQTGSVLLEEGMIVSTDLFQRLFDLLPTHMSDRILEVSGCFSVALTWFAAHQQSNADGIIAVSLTKPLQWQDPDAFLMADQALLDERDECLTFLYRELALEAGWPIPAAACFVQVVESYFEDNASISTPQQY